MIFFLIFNCGHLSSPVALAKQNEKPKDHHVPPVPMFNLERKAWPDLVGKSMEGSLVCLGCMFKTWVYCIYLWILVVEDT